MLSIFTGTKLKITGWVEDAFFEINTDPAGAIRGGCFEGTSVGDVGLSERNYLLHKHHIFEQM